MLLSICVSSPLTVVMAIGVGWKSFTYCHQIHFGSAPATECVLWHIACQGGAEKVSPWQAIPHRVRSTPSALPK